MFTDMATKLCELTNIILDSQRTNSPNKILTQDRMICILTSWYTKIKRVFVKESWIPLYLRWFLDEIEEACFKSPTTALKYLSQESSERVHEFITVFLHLVAH